MDRICSIDELNAPRLISAVCFVMPLSSRLFPLPVVDDAASYVADDDPVADRDDPVADDESSTSSVR